MAESVNYILQVKDRFSASLDRFSKQMGRVQKNAQKASAKLRQFSAATSQMGKNLSAKLTAPIVAAGTASIFAFAKMESGLNNVLNLLDNQAAVDKFSGSLKSLQKEAIKTGFSIGDTNKALFSINSALGVGKKATDAFRQSQILAVGGGASLEAASFGLTSIMSAYGSEVKNAAEVSNTLFAAQVKGQTDVERLSNNIGKVSAIARQAGVPFQELAAVMSALTLAGISTEESATGLRAALTFLKNPPKEVQKALEAMEIPFGVMAIRGKGLTTIIERLSIASKKYPELLNKSIPNIQAANTLLSLNAEKIKIVREIQKKINKDIKNGTGLQEAYNRKIKETSQVLLRAKGSMTVAAAAIGEALAPAVIKIAKKISILADKFSALSPQTQKFIIIFAGLVAVVGPALIVLGAMVNAFLILTSPISLVIIAIAALVIGLAYAQKKWNIFGVAMDWVNNNFKKFLVIISIALGPLGIMIGLVVTLQKKFDILGKTFRGIKSFFGFGGSPLGAGADSSLPESLGINKTLNINNTSGLKGQAKQAAPQTQRVDVSGKIDVNAKPGATVDKAEIFSPNIGMNVAHGFG